MEKILQFQMNILLIYLDRVGGGDAFTAGVLHGILNNMVNEEIIEFAICASSLKHSILGDINIVDEQTIISLIEKWSSKYKKIINGRIRSCK